MLKMCLGGPKMAKKAILAHPGGPGPPRPPGAEISGNFGNFPDFPGGPGGRKLPIFPGTFRTHSSPAHIFRPRPMIVGRGPLNSPDTPQNTPEPRIFNPRTPRTPPGASPKTYIFRWILRETSWASASPVAQNWPSALTFRYQDPPQKMPKKCDFVILSQKSA